MTSWAPEIRQRKGPRYLAIAEALADDAGAGRLRPGARLPTHRELADRLGLTVGTVTRAYAEAARRNLISGEVGRGTFVRGPAARFATAPGGLYADPGLIDLSANHPPTGPGDGEAVTLARALKALAGRKDLARLLDYPPPGGAHEHRAAGAEWARRSGLEVTADRVLVSSGNQHGMTAVLAALLSPGDLVLTEALTYPGMKNLAGLLSLHLQGVALDEQGMRPDALAAACRARSPKALYCVPTLQNPTTSIMSEERRRQIAAVAREHGVLIVEDDVHGRIPERAPRPLSAFAPERAVYLTGTSKVLARGAGGARRPHRGRDPRDHVDGGAAHGRDRRHVDQGRHRGGNPEAEETRGDGAPPSGREGARPHRRPGAPGRVSPLAGPVEAVAGRDLCRRRAPPGRRRDARVRLRYRPNGGAGRRPRLPGRRPRPRPAPACPACAGRASRGFAGAGAAAFGSLTIGAPFAGDAGILLQ